MACKQLTKIIFVNVVFFYYKYVTDKNKKHVFSIMCLTLMTVM